MNRPFPCANLGRAGAESHNLTPVRHAGDGTKFASHATTTLPPCLRAAPPPRSSLFHPPLRIPAIPLSVVCVGLLSGILIGQSQFPVGGYSKPIWRAHGHGSFLGAEVCPDLTGDGIEDVLCHHWDPGGDVVLDGVTGEIWLRAPRGFGIDNSVLIEDLDGDGTADLVLRNDQYSTATITEAGAIALVQGGSGKLLWQVEGKSAQEHLGQQLQLVDLDGSGLPDVLSFVPGSSMTAMSGQTGTWLWQLNIPRMGEVRQIGDQNGDGIVDLLGLGFNYVALIDGATGTYVWTDQAIVELEYWSHTDFVDLNGDSIDDIVIRNWKTSSRLSTWEGGVQALDGRSGQLLWEVLGDSPFASLGRTLHIYDADGDQNPDLLISGADLITALDGGSGTTLWSHIGSVSQTGSAHWLETEINQDGTPDLIYRDGHSPDNQIIALNGRDGSELWSAMANDPAALIREMQLVDLDADGDLDLVAAIPHSDHQSEVMAVDIFTGAAKWSHLRAFGFGERMAAFVDSHGTTTVLASTRGNKRPPTILGLSGTDGSVKWGVPQSEDAITHAWHWQDINDDGDLELIDFESHNHVVQLIHPESGEMFNRLQTDMRMPTFSGTLPDMDGDGYREIVSASGNSYEPSVLVHSGFQDSYFTGLTLIGERLSASKGGLVVVGVQFQRSIRNGSYRLLLSAHGTGPTELLGVDVPLTSDRAFQLTESGIYPSTFHAPIGRLDANAEAVIAIQVRANRIPSSLVGHQVHLAVFGESQDGWARFSTGAESISILP